MSTSGTTSGTDPNDPYATRIAEATETISPENGRTLAYCAFGDPEGEPLFVFHGGVGSRGFGLLFEEPASGAGVRIVSPDRPGYGRSDPQPARGLLDWPDDVAAVALDRGHDRFAVLGVSGGGPYAAACAYALPDRLTTAGVVRIQPKALPEHFSKMQDVSLYGPSAVPRPRYGGSRGDSRLFRGSA